MRIYIPSLGRHDDRVIRSPAAQLPPGSDVHWVVPEYQARQYSSTLERYCIQGSVLACPVSGISMVRQWIADHAAQDGHDKLCMMDDDIGFLVRRSADTWQLRGATKTEVGQMVDWISRMLDTHDHVGISAREGNNRLGVGTPETLVDANTRMLRLLSYQTDRLRCMEHGRVQVMEDFDISLQLLRSGGSNVVSFWWAQGQRMTNESGGCSTYRTHEVHERSARRLAELHPGLVRLRQKENKTDRAGFGTRTEVTISWKKAAQQ